MTQYQKIRFVAVCCFSGKRLQLTEFTRIYAYILSGLRPSLFIEVPVPSQKSERSCICALVVSILPLSTILIFDFEIVPMARYFSFYFPASMHLWYSLSLNSREFLTNAF